MALRQRAWLAVVAALITQLANVWPNVPSEGTASSSPRIVAHYETRHRLPQRMLGASIEGGAGGMVPPSRGRPLVRRRLSDGGAQVVLDM